VFLGQHGLYLSGSHALAAAARSACNGLGGIWAIQPGRFGETLSRERSRRG
jgi:hypothetical protein